MSRRRGGASPSCRCRRRGRPSGRSEELLAIGLVREVRGGLLEDDVVKREGLAEMEREGLELNASQDGGRVLTPAYLETRRGRLKTR
eukprot:4251049-Prymnesium_polylepis.1